MGGRRRCRCGAGLPTLLVGTEPGFAEDRLIDIGAYDISWRRPFLHRRDHGRWLGGATLPPPLRGEVRDDILRVSSGSGPEAHTLAYGMATLLAREEGWDPGWASTSAGVCAADELTSSVSRMALAVEDGRVVGFVIARYRRDTLAIATAYRTGEDPSSAPYHHCIDRAFVCVRYRGKRLAQRLVRTVAGDVGVAPEDLAWEAPLTESGERLARAITGPGRQILLVGQLPDPDGAAGIGAQS